MIASRSTLVAERARLAATGREKPRRRHVLIAAGIFLAAVLIVSWVGLLDAVSYRAFIPNSDDANAILASHDMAQGNFVLHHWQLRSDNYWPLDLLLGVPFLLFDHPAEVSLHWVPLAVAVITVAVACLAASRWAPRSGARIGAVVATFAIIGLPGPLFAEFFLQGPMHVLTTAACLAAFVLLAPPVRAWRWTFGALVLMLAVTGDPLAWAIGVGPIAAATLLEVARRRDVRRLGSHLAVIGMAALGSVSLHAILGALGGFSTMPSPLVTPAGTWLHKVPLATRTLVAILGATPGSPMPTSSPPLHWIHAIGALLVLVGVLLGVWGAARSLAAPLLDRRTNPRGGRAAELGGRWREDTVLLGFLGSIAIFVVATPASATVFYNRYLNPAVIFGAVLAGRAVGSILGKLRRKATIISGACAIFAVALYVATPVAMAESAPARSPYAPVITWLQAHHLDHGYGAYWSASSLTVLSGDKLSVETVANVGNRLHGVTLYGTSQSYLPDPRRPARFLVFQRKGAAGNVNLPSAVATFGQYSQVADIGGFRVVVWSGPDLAPRLGRVLAMTTP